MANVTSLLSVLVLLGGLVAAAMLLRRYRDRLNTAFVKGPIAIKGVTNLGDGSRLILVDVNGQQAYLKFCMRKKAFYKKINEPDKQEETDSKDSKG